MIKTLLKKQMMEVFSWIYRNKKTGNSRQKRSIVGYILLYLLVFGFLGYMFFEAAQFLCAPLVSANFGWLYTVLMGLIGIALGVFGSVFSTYSSLYLARDNDFLLSMPIPASKILLVRLVGVYAVGLMYELIVMVPSIIVFFINVRVSVTGVLFTILIPFVLSVFVLTLSCILGFFVALIGSKLKNKKIITVILSLAFIAGYYYMYGKAYSVLQSIIADPETLGSKVKSLLYPFYHMGLAAEGNAVSMLIFTGVIAVLFGGVYFVLSRSFLKITTTNKGSVKSKYNGKAISAGNINSALLKKEFRRFLGSTTYMLNCGLGIVIMIIAAVALIIKNSVLKEMLGQFNAETEQMIYLAAVGVLCMITTMNDITAPSVSLEGKNLWLLKSYPVPAKAALYAKLKLHLILTLIPAMILTLSVLFVIEPPPFFWLLIPPAVVLFVILSALWGLFLALKMPNLEWTNEAVPVKQSMSVLLALFGGWAAVLVLGGLYFAVVKWVSPVAYLFITLLLLAVLSILLFRWVKTKGVSIFESL